jgi:catechol 2,3-dioxygenase-like lactoylglutathione lyase family enzyme
VEGCVNPKNQELDMSSTDVRSKHPIESPKAAAIGMKLEVVAIPVSDIDRAQRFYSNLGWRLDGEFVKGDAFRAFQFTPPGSACSIHFGKGVTSAKPGSAQGLFLVVPDIEATRAALIDRGVDVSEVLHRTGVGEPPRSGLHPQRQTYASFATFSDPDGNSWIVQEVTARLPGRVDANDTAFTSSTELASALQRAAAAHGEHEKRTGQHDADWPAWYAEYIVQEQAGKPLPS